MYNNKEKMTFSENVKKQLKEIKNLNDKEQLKYELLGFVLNYLQDIFKYGLDELIFTLRSNESILRLSFLLVNLSIDFEINENKLKIKNINKLKQVLLEICILDEKLYLKSKDYIKNIISGLILENSVIYDPNKTYMLKFHVIYSSFLDDILDNIKDELIYYEIGFKSYKKEDKMFFAISNSDNLSKIFAYLGISKSVLDIEEIRVSKENNKKMSARLNAISYNLNKTVDNSIKQIEIINLLKNKGKFEALPDFLKEIANLRVKYPEDTLKELRQRLEPKLSKQGVQYRLKQLERYI